MSKRQARMGGSLELTCQFPKDVKDQASLLRICHNHDGGIGSW